MNKVILIGRLTRDPDIRYSQNGNNTAIARYTLAVDRSFRRDGDPEADFISCVAFGRQAEFAERFLRKGIKIGVVGRIQTGSYTNRDGNKVYTTDVIIENQEFVESKAANDRARAAAGSEGAAYGGGRGQGGYSRPDAAPAAPTSEDNAAGSGSADSLDGFMNIPDSIDDDLPFH